MLLALFKNEIKNELNNILSWWTLNMTDWEYGGFVGRIDGRGRKHSKADKGIILNTRILWTYSKIYHLKGDIEYLELADRAYQYICRYFWDEEYGGVFWMSDYQGNVINPQKQIYAQAFTIYALSAYYQIHPDPEVASRLNKIFNCIEDYSLDREKGGYLNVFNRDWTLAEDQKLSEKDADQVKIMNTHLHILEAYSALYHTCPMPEYHQALEYIVTLYMDRFCTRNPCHVYLFFDSDWQPTSDEISFGHDIESSWLLTEAAERLDNPVLTLKARKVCLELVKATCESGLDHNGGLFEKTHSSGIGIEKEKHWWPQAEGVIGFINAWQISGDDKYLRQAIQTWHFIQNHFIDHEQGEWHWLVDENGDPNRKEDKAGPWKAPYHNVRMCLEVLQRINVLTA